MEKKEVNRLELDADLREDLIKFAELDLSKVTISKMENVTTIESHTTDPNILFLPMEVDITLLDLDHWYLSCLEEYFTNLLDLKVSRVKILSKYLLGIRWFNGIIMGIIPNNCVGTELLLAKRMYNLKDGNGVKITFTLVSNEPADIYSLDNINILLPDNYLTTNSGLRIGDAEFYIQLRDVLYKHNYRKTTGIQQVLSELNVGNKIIDRMNIYDLSTHTVNGTDAKINIERTLTPKIPVFTYGDIRVVSYGSTKFTVVNPQLVKFFDSFVGFSPSDYVSDIQPYRISTQFFPEENNINE